MTNVRFACAQIEVIPGRPDLNFSRMLSAIETARQTNVDILLFPELALPGYFLGDLWERQSFLDDCEKYGQKLVEATAGICVIFGNIGLDRGKINEDGGCRKYNAAFVAHNKELLSTAGPYNFLLKTAMPNYRVFEDSRHFHSSLKLSMELALPLSQLLQPVAVTIRGHVIKIGVMLCEDGWTDNYETDIPKLLAANGANLLCNLSCSPFSLQKNTKRHKIFSAQSKELRLPLIYCNNIGTQNNGKNVIVYDGCSSFYQANGTLLCEAPAYDDCLLTCNYNAASNSFIPSSANIKQNKDNCELFMAVSYGAANFLKQIGITKIAVGLSGGIDSAVAAALFVHILGAENVLLVNMPSVYNSALTKSLSLQIAENLGANYCIIPIDHSVEHTYEQLQTAIIRNYSTDSFFSTQLSDLNRENIQARDRTRILAGLASAFGGAFSCNSNKTELTVGYATFYGDLAGVLAPIGDLWKYQVYDLGRYLNEVVFNKQVIPEEVFAIAPSAELSSEQTVGVGRDPIIYDYHDHLFQAMMENGRKTSPNEILKLYEAGLLETAIGCRQGIVDTIFPNSASFVRDLERWWNLFTGFAVAKRIQAPPIVTVSKSSFGYDYREAQLQSYYSPEYYEIRQRLLSVRK
ncbi:MAG: NAD(+) synthase [Acholeplasmataceae bacterium]|nr:NAD(+) synthase [Acholeplasmataceae bacterium]